MLYFVPNCFTVNSWIFPFIFIPASISRNWELQGINEFHLLCAASWGSKGLSLRRFYTTSNRVSDTTTKLTIDLSIPPNSVYGVSKWRTSFSRTHQCQSLEMSEFPCENDVSASFALKYIVNFMNFDISICFRIFWPCFPLPIVSDQLTNFVQFTTEPRLVKKTLTHKITLLIRHPLQYFSTSKIHMNPAVQRRLLSIYIAEY